MIDVSVFVFSDLVTRARHVARVVEIPQSIATKDEIISLMARGLEAPDYFGANWDALDECLRDLSWLKEHSIVIKHDGVPQMPVDLLRMYLDILASAVRSWRSEDEHEFVVTFPSSARDELAMIARGPVPGLGREQPS